jgi:hypothetical protein
MIFSALLLKVLWLPQELKMEPAFNTDSVSLASILKAPNWRLPARNAIEMVSKRLFISNARRGR